MTKISVVGTRGIPEVLGGVETHCENLYPLIAGHGLNITVLARSSYVDYSHSHFNGVSLKSVWAPKKKSIEAIFHTFLAAIVAKRDGSKLIHVHAIGPGLLVPFCKLLGLKVIFTHHGPDYDRQKWGWLAKNVLKLGERLAVNFADEVIVISNVINNLIKTRYGRMDAHLIYNGVKPFKLRYEAKNKFLAKHNLVSRKYIVAVGRFVEEKGFHDLIEAYSKVETELSLVLVGDSDHPSKYSNDLKALALKTNNVLLTGFIKGDELTEIFSNAKAFIMPSYHEGLPIALLEAMSYSLPVVVSDIPANLEVGLPSDFYFETGNVKNLTENIQTITNNNFISGEYSKYLKYYDWNDIAHKTIKIYEKALA